MERVAVIGLGNIATRHRHNFKRLYPESTVYAMSASGRIPEEVVSDCDLLVSDIDALITHQVQMVIVASPASFHARHSIPLIEAGIPVLIEKPVTASVNDVQAIVNAVVQYETPVAVGYCLRYLPSSLRIKQLLEDGKIGHLYNAFVEIGQYLPDWRPSKDYHESVSASVKLGGGALLELSHELDYSQWLLGSLHIQYAILRSSEELGLDVEDLADILALSEQGVVTHIHLDFLQRKAQRKCRFIGNQGVLEWDLIRNEITLISAAGSQVLYSEPEWDKNLMYLEMVMDFERLIGNQPNMCISLNEAKNTIMLVSIAKQLAVSE